MNLDSYQICAGRTMDLSMSTSSQMQMAALGLAGETGEVVERVKKLVYHQHDLEATIQAIEEECGDVLWYLAAMATACGLSLSEIADKNIKKLEKRYPQGFDPERSKNRS